MKRVTARKKLRVKLADIKEWLNRRSQRKALTWEKFNLMDERFPLPRPRMRVNLFARPKAPVQIDLL